MSKILRHRGPDDEGFCLLSHSESNIYCKGNDSINELGNLPHIADSHQINSHQIGFVHRRLSILDLSAAGHQPMSYHDEKYTIVFNGEIYNYKELKSELLQKGFQFNSDSDTEVILAAYQNWGADCVTHFIGNE